MWFMGAKENKVSPICFIPLDYDKPLQTNMSLGTAWLCWGREYPLVMWGESTVHSFGAVIAKYRFLNVGEWMRLSENRLISRSQGSVWFM